MANHRRFISDNGEDPFRAYVLRELKAQREAQKRMLGMIGTVARDVARLSASVTKFAKLVITRLDRMDGRLDRVDDALAEILRRLPPRPA